jgi:hypothetical protein
MKGRLLASWTIFEDRNAILRDFQEPNRSGYARVLESSGDAGSCVYTILIFNYRVHIATEIDSTSPAQSDRVYRGVHPSVLRSIAVAGDFLWFDRPKAQQEPGTGAPTDRK